MTKICTTCSNKYNCIIDTSSNIVECCMYNSQPDFSELYEKIADKIADKVFEQIKEKDRRLEKFRYRKLYSQHSVRKTA